MIGNLCTTDKRVALIPFCTSSAGQCRASYSLIKFNEQVTRLPGNTGVSEPSDSFPQVLSEYLLCTQWCFFSTLEKVHKILSDPLELHYPVR